MRILIICSGNFMNDKFHIEKLRDEIIIRLKTVKGKTAADIGADTGFISEGLINAGLKVIAFDPLPSAVNFLQDKFRDIAEFEAVLTSPETIDINDESFDYAFAYLYLQRSEIPENQVKEIFRILKHGGKAAVIEIMQGESSEHVTGNNDIPHGFPLPDIYAWFINAGFQDISIEKTDQLIIYSDSSGAEVRADIFIAYGEK